VTHVIAAWLAALPGHILAALGDLGRLLQGAGRSLVAITRSLMRSFGR
jgi:hypothetical protein